ncbi:paraquat-inducible protein B [Variovorax beijingensis]|uniref:Paraquat-inducible protein B n=2 Tax=Variovorax TaxID=34072 RepID=A0AAE3Y5T0_VARPD|nr:MULTISPECIES: MlaD family protein [Variovorax]MBD9665900.1 MCE family protein [Variovorax sp. VRV01]MDP9968562.1 paraquat-inducible protein B [Variovorax paradoxus]MDR6430102.1 paraquat-inducible protein B [Variovorax paradoxus]MDR6456674.1 paraquat-inducible protein B [Variovorax paradoxus]TWD75545.1 paraquat-inducible protein B [Variovorax beijingensis]
MSDDEARPPNDPSPPSGLPPPRVVRRREWLPSLIWLIPIVAALVGVMLVVRILMQRGPEIVLTFNTAEGLEANKTAVKYKDVQIGTVQSLRLARDRSHVRVTVQLSKEAESFTAEDSRFWVVRPRLDTSGISGLGTLLSGAYIGADAGVSKETASEFKGLEVPPIVTRDASGQQYLLRATDVGSLDVGSPVYFRRIKVGQVAAYELDGDGRGVTLRIFVNAPYDKFVGVNTRFWQASGIDAQLSASGFTLRTQSLATILLGGIAFQAPDDAMGPLAKENTAFTLAQDETAAMKEPDGPPQTLLMYFNQSLRGLAPGAPVDFRGVVIGEVKSIGVEFDRAEREFRMPVLVQVYPDRLRRRAGESGVESRATQQERLRFLAEKGLRAQLRNGNLLTGQVYVALDFFPKAPPARIDMAKNPIELPTIANSLDEIQSQVQEIASKLNKVPYEQIAADLRTTLASLNKTLASTEQAVSRINTDLTPELAAAMKDVRKTVNSAERTLADDSPLQQDMRQTLRELTRAAGSVRVLTDYLERHPESLLRGKPDDKK